MTPHILLIDDDAALLRMATTCLQSEGFTVTTATDGLDALETLERDTFDAVVLDLRMPRMDGRAFYREMIARGHRPPTVVLSAYGADAARQELGAESALEKPFDPEVLIERVRVLLQPKTASGPPPQALPVVLVIDDEEAILRLLRLMLQSEALDCHFVAAPSEAIAFLGTRKPDLIILDLLLPEMDGLQLLHEIRKLEYHGPVLCLSALDASNPLLQQITRELGEECVLQKPFDPEVVLERMYALVSH